MIFGFICSYILASLFTLDMFRVVLFLHYVSGVYVDFTLLVTLS